MNRLIFLKNIPHFEGLLLEELVVIDEELEEEIFDDGATIFHEGEEGDRFYLVYEGEVDLTRGDRHVATIGPGGHFAEMALFDDAPRSASATAKGRCILLSLDKQTFHTLMIQRPTILFQICRELSRRLRATDQAQV